MNEQDKRAVEGLAKCGIDLDGLCRSFPAFPQEEIKAVYENVHNEQGNADEPEIKMNCS